MNSNHSFSTWGKSCVAQLPQYILYQSQWCIRVDNNLIHSILNLMALTGNKKDLSDQKQTATILPFMQYQNTVHKFLCFFQILASHTPWNQEARFSLWAVSFWCKAKSHQMPLIFFLICRCIPSSSPSRQILSKLPGWDKAGPPQPSLQPHRLSGDFLFVQIR